MIPGHYVGDNRGLLSFMLLELQTPFLWSEGSIKSSSKCVEYSVRYRANVATVKVQSETGLRQDNGHTYQRNSHVAVISTLVSDAFSDGVSLVSIS